MLKSLFQRPWAQMTALVLALAAAFLSGAAVVTAYQHRETIIMRLSAEIDKPVSDILTVDWTTLETGLLTLERADIPLGQTAWWASGGAIDAIGNTVLYISSSGHIATLDLDRGVFEYSPFRAPMNYDYLQQNVFNKQPSFHVDGFRVQDALIVRGQTEDSAVLYVSHHVFDEATSEFCSVISRTGLDLENGSFKLTDGVWTELFRISECVSMEEFDWVFIGMEGGGKMLQLDAEHLLLSVGDYGIAWELGIANDRVGKQYSNDFSKLLRINMVTGEAKVFANGVRNPQGLTMDDDGNIWEAEHGPQGGDEINLVREGADFGWPTVSLGMHYGEPRAPIPTNPVQGRHEGFDPPVMAFLPSVGLSAIAAIPEDTKAFGLWSGDLIATSLVGQTLFHIRRDADRLIYAEPIVLGGRLRDIALLDNGWIALLGNQDENLILLRDAAAQGENTSASLSVSGYGAVAVREAAVAELVPENEGGRFEFRSKCSSCHSLDGSPKAGPHLNGVVGRNIASLEDYVYSDALAEADGRWTTSRLIEFMEYPHEMYPGTTMPGGFGLDKWQRREVAEYLASIE